MENAMNVVDNNQQGYRTTVGSNHLESYLHAGLYKDNPEIRRFGMLLMHDNEMMAFHRTDNGIVIDVKQQNRHLILGTANYGDPISKVTWLCIARAVAMQLGGEFMSDTFVPSDSSLDESEGYTEVFLSHLKHFGF